MRAGASLFCMDTQQAGLAEDRARQPMTFMEGVGLALDLPADVLSPYRIVASFFNFPAYDPVTDFHNERKGGQGEGQLH
ncbi:hypothetical protein SB719_16575 [Pantoea sp. SIMBA_079]|uniref:hypothetical protein n=1 Tax=Pantoea sp. SIMBA_079 TaxID=3085817 RepID=UPI003990F9AD